MNIIKGDLLSAKGLIVHGCNCMGVMGSGVALAIKEKWPIVYTEYKDYHRNAGLRLGDIHWVRVSRDTIVINAMTQHFYGRDGTRYVDYDAVKECFRKVANLARSYKMQVNYPLIGCGLAGGDWNVVESIIEEQLQGIQHNLYIKE